MIRKTILFIAYFLFVFLISFFFKKREGFTQNNQLANKVANKVVVEERKNIVLLGDSVFFNDPYVKAGNSVCDKLKVKIANQGKQSKLYCLAENDALMVDIYQQLDNVNRDALNNKNTTVFISVGGNDILNFYKNLSINPNDNKNENKNNTQDNNTQANSVDPENMKVLFNAYIKLIDAIIARLPLVQVKLFNIYSPLSKDYLIYNAPIRKWNGLLNAKFQLDTKFQPYRNVTIINNFGFMNQRADFNYDIEPSPIGAEKIANAIMINL